MQHIRAATLLEGLARGEGGVAVLAVEVRRQVVRGVMHQVALERAGRDREQYFLVHQVVAPACIHAVEEARAPVGIALAVREPAAEETVAPRHAVHRRDRRGERGLDGLGEIGRDVLVGVQAQHPVMARLLDRELLLHAEAEPFLLHHARASALGDLDGAVGRPRVDDYDLVDEGEAVEAGLEHGRGVARDEDRGERRPGRRAQACFLAISSCAGESLKPSHLAAKLRRPILRSRQTLSTLSTPWCSTRNPAAWITRRSAAGEKWIRWISWNFLS